MIVPLNRSYSNIACGDRRVQNIVYNSVAVLISIKYLIMRENRVKPDFQFGLLNMKINPLIASLIHKMYKSPGEGGETKGLFPVSPFSLRNISGKSLKSSFLGPARQTAAASPVQRVSSLHVPRCHIVDENIPAPNC